MGLKNPETHPAAVGSHDGYPGAWERKDYDLIG